MEESDVLDDDLVITCWCGDKGTYDELFDDDGLDPSCGGTGYVDCHCGGDICVCHHHGQEVECRGCHECPDDVNEPDGWAEQWNPEDGAEPRDWIPDDEED